MALISANSAPMLEALLAIMGLGAVAVPLNTRWTPREVAAAFRLAAPALVLVEQSLYGMLDETAVSPKV